MISQFQRKTSISIPGKISRLLGREHFLPILFIAIALGIQGFIFLTGRVPLDQDEAYMGITGLDIMKGSIPVLFPGQNYMGCLEAYFHVIFRFLIGASLPLTLKMQAAVQTLIFLITFYLFARRFFDRSMVFVFRI
ncbi:hypothetical protein JW926_11055 [Candidatus Sumerlaeota bacterium]|nr:hypothetical protein [Candidatus Sumerlaeota bacterium]